MEKKKEEFFWDRKEGASKTRTKTRTKTKTRSEKIEKEKSSLREQKTEERIANKEIKLTFGQ